MPVISNKNKSPKGAISILHGFSPLKPIDGCPHSSIVFTVCRFIFLWRVFMFDYPPFLEFTRPRGAPGSNYPKLSGNSVPRGSKLTAVRVINRATRFFGGFTNHLFWNLWGMYVWPWRGFGPGWPFSVLIIAFYKITRRPDPNKYWDYVFYYYSKEKARIKKSST